MLTLGGGSFGFQIGGQSTDVLMVIMNKRGAEFLVSNKFNIGGDLSAAAGPVGRDATASTDVALNAEIYTYSRSRGLFAGVSLKGAVVKPDNDANKRIYGRSVGAQYLLMNGSVPPPAAARPLMEALSRYAPKK
jgi:lipid-binding SYLF domain-containing protein